MSTGPRIYNLFPTLAGPIEGVPEGDWYSHLERIAAMGFDWLAVNPFHAAGFSGSLYAIKDPYALHPLVRGASDKPTDQLLSDFIKSAGNQGLGFMMDLVINHTSKDSPLAEAHPDWYRRNLDGTLYSPRAIDPSDARNVTVWGDLAQLDYDHPGVRAKLIAYWSEYIRHYVRLGVRGFRCDAAYQVPAKVWSELIAAARNEVPESLFVAETLGCTLEQVSALQRAGFDYLFNSSKWWDFNAPWLFEQYEEFRHIAPSIAFPESHDTERLVNELESQNQAQIKRRYTFSYLFSAIFSSGIMIPMGFEYGFSKALNVVHTRPEEWFTQLETQPFDLTTFIAQVNALKAACPALNNEGPQAALSTSEESVIALHRLGGESGEVGCSISLINPSPQEPARVDVTTLLSRIQQSYDVFTEITPERTPEELVEGKSLQLEPLTIRVFRGDYASAKDHLRDITGVAPSDNVMRAIVGADNEDPFSVRGMHEGGPDGDVVVRAFLPGDQRVEVVDATTGKIAGTLNRLHKDGFFAGVIKHRKTRFDYRLRATNWEGKTREFKDPYAFPLVLGNTDVYLLAEGTHRRAYTRLGAQLTELEGIAGVSFAVWAPNARRVSVVGDFNQWDGRTHPMRLRHECGVWELFVPEIGEGHRYKYEIKGAHGELLPLKADPYGFAAEKPPKTASIVRRTDGFQWSDHEWLAQREARNVREAPISIYEVQLGSWKRVAEEHNRYLSYGELADRLVPYVQEMGFTHIELLPISEYPFDGSWGYQPIGLFAPTSRFGDPEDFKVFVDRCHQAGIGIVFDWVPGHFPEDVHGLGYFDGTHLYEHADPRKGFHQDWNTLIYNYGRNEVANFLLSNAMFWLDRYHIDGLRVDAVASMLYLDYSRQSGQWIPNQYGGNENIEAIQFLKRMNELVYSEYPGIVTMAEESTSWPGVSRPTHLGGLGFGYKWNMGWMHDTLQYMGNDPIHRGYHHDQMTFSLTYAFSENFILPLSHDEVVHGKRSLLDRMPGDAWQKFANLRAYLGFMWTHPGKKLLFMGCEFAQGREWNHDTGLDWNLLDVHWHAGIQQLVRDLNWFYRNTKALHETDCYATGFEWLKVDETKLSILAFLRRGLADSRTVVVVCNFTPVPRINYRIGVPAEGFYTERLNTDAAIYGGSNVGNSGGVQSQHVSWEDRPHSIEMVIPPLATVIFEHDEP